MSWFILRLVLVSCGITIPVLCICLVKKEWESGSNAGLFLTYMLQTDFITAWVFELLDRFQTQFIAYERIVQYT
jgi:hypothetical protein